MHAEDHYWDGRSFKAEGGKAFKSVSLGELEMDDCLRSELTKNKQANFDRFLSKNQQTKVQ